MAESCGHERKAAEHAAESRASAESETVESQLRTDLVVKLYKSRKGDEARECACERCVFFCFSFFCSVLFAREFGPDTPHPCFFLLFGFQLRFARLR